MLRCVLFCMILFPCLSAIGQAARPTGVVRGTVVDIDGKPVAGATVFLAGGRSELPTRTKDDGSFELAGIAVGRAFVVAYKQVDGYPWNFSNFYDLPGEQFPTVTVEANQIVQGLLLRLGQKGAYLRLHVSDGRGAAVRATVYFWRPDHDEIRHRGVRAKGDDWDCEEPVVADKPLLVPPVPIRIAVDAEGFQRWYYGGDQWDTDKGLITLNSGKTLDLSIQLQRIQ